MTLLNSEDSSNSSLSQMQCNLELFNAVEYDSTHLWELQIDGAPAPFDKWFPAQSCSDMTNGASVSQMSFGIEEVNIINAYNARSIRVEIKDNDSAVLESWLENWQNDVSTENNYGFNYPEEFLRYMYIRKFNWQHQLVYTKQYAVVPVGQIGLDKTDDPQVKVLNVNFAVFGSKKLNN